MAAAVPRESDFFLCAGVQQTTNAGGFSVRGIYLGGMDRRGDSKIALGEWTMCVVFFVRICSVKFRRLSITPSLPSLFSSVFFSFFFFFFFSSCFLTLSRPKATREFLFPFSRFTS